MAPPRDRPEWAEWERNAHRPEIQERIREAVRRGLIRVIPTPDGGIRIVPGEGRPAGDSG